MTVREPNGLLHVRATSNSLSASGDQAFADKPGRFSIMKFPEVRVPQCHVCICDDWRAAIEVNAGELMPYREIVERLPEEAHKRGRITANGIRNHINRGHASSAVFRRAQIAEARAKEIGQAFEEGIDFLADHMLFARLVIQTTAEEMLAGKQVPTIQEAIAASRFMADMEARGAEGDLNIQQINRAFAMYWKAIEENVDRDTAMAIAAQIRQNQILDSFAKREAIETSSQTADDQEDVYAG